MLSLTERSLLRELDDVVARLRVAGIVRSGNITGDIGEWLIVREYGLELEESCRKEGYEGHIELEGVRYRAQVKVHNSTEGTNVRVGNPLKYDLLFVVVGPTSTLRDARVIEGGAKAFHVYVFESAEIMRDMNAYPNGTYSCAKTVLHTDAPFSVLPY